MKPRQLLLSACLITTLLLAACAPVAPLQVPAAPTEAPAPAPTEVPPPTEAPKPAEAPAPAIEIGPDGMVVPHKLFVDAAGNCTKTVKLTMMTHGDYMDKNVDERYGLGLLLKRWDEGQPCVELELTPVPPGDAPAFAQSQFIAGTPSDIISTWSTDTWFDNKWVIQFDDYFAAKNPYSPNATWYEDFPYPDLTMRPYPVDNHWYWVRCCIRTGATGPDGIVYNADILKAAGVDVEKQMPPKTMTEFMDIQAKVKASGKIPFWLSLAGDTRWEIDWYGRFIMDQLMPDIAAQMDKAVDEVSDDRWGTLSEMEWVHGILAGIFKATDERVGEYFRIMKEWSQYWEPGYASPAELVGEVASEFLKGNVAMTTVGRWRISTLQNYPNLGFAWGTFFLPPIDKEFSKFATGEPVRRHSTGEPASTVIVPLFIASQVEKDADKLAAGVDLFQYVTAPTSLDFYCSQLIIPCFKPGASLDEIFKGDKVREQQLLGFFEPAPIDIPVIGVYHVVYSMRGGSDEVTRLMVEYLQGNITLEELQTRVQEGLTAGATDICNNKLEQKVAGWEWCSELVK